MSQSLDSTQIAQRREHGQSVCWGQTFHDDRGQTMHLKVEVWGRASWVAFLSVVGQPGRMRIDRLAGDGRLVERMILEALRLMDCPLPEVPDARDGGNEGEHT
jgi:hypothetical protein